MNSHKSQIYGWNCFEDIMASTAKILALPTSKNWKTFTYIWMPIIEEKTPRSAWEIFFDNIEKKFEN